MAVFSDRDGRQWAIACNITTIERVKAVTGVNLCDLAAGELYDRLNVDCVLLMRILAAICEPQFQTHGVTHERFLEAIQGDPVDSGKEAILDAMRDFFPTRLRDVLEGLRAVDRKLKEIGKQNLANLGTAIDGCSTPTNVPQSLVSTLDGLPSDLSTR